MILVSPVQFDETNFTSSIAEPDLSLGEVLWTAGTYSLGDQAIYNHIVYEVVATTTTDRPDVGAAKSVPEWIQVKYSNKWSVCDRVISAPALADDSISYTVNSGQLINSAAGFGLVNVDAVNVTVNDPLEGLVYDNDVDMLDLSNVVDYYTWFFEPLSKNKQFLLVDLPAYPDATVTITATGTGQIGIGELAVGQQRELGVTQHGSGVQLLNYTDRSTDEFGSLLPIKIRRKAKLVDFVVKIEKNRTNYVLNTLQDFGDYPCVFYGVSTSDDPTLVYGLYLDTNINFETFSLYDLTVQVRGLT